MEPFDYAVRDFAFSIGVESEVVYRVIDSYNLGYRHRLTEQQLFAALDRAKADLTARR